MSDTTVFILLAIDTNPDPAPHEVWTLRSWSRDFLGGFTHDVDNLPPDAELVRAFRAAGTRIHLYECSLNGDSAELVPFERVAEPQPPP
jgi:hypothetical protein